MESASNNLELKFAQYAPDVWQKLAEIPRTGWVKRKIPDPETVQEHTISLLELVAIFPDFSPEEKQEIISMLEVHDWPESISGDISTYTNDPEERKRLLEEKEKLELAAMEKIRNELGEVGETIFGLWQRFEYSDDSLAVFARELDKYQAVEKAAEYQAFHYRPFLDEFRNHARQFIKNPILLERMKNLG